MSDILSNTHKYTQNVNGEKKRNDSRKREGNIKNGGLNLQYKYFFVWRGGGFLPSKQGERRLRERSFQKCRDCQPPIS